MAHLEIIRTDFLVDLCHRIEAESHQTHCWNHSWIIRCDKLVLCIISNGTLQLIILPPRYNPNVQVFLIWTAAAFGINFLSSLSTLTDSRSLVFRGSVIMCLSGYRSRRRICVTLQLAASISIIQSSSLSTLKWVRGRSLSSTPASPFAFVFPAFEKWYSTDARWSLKSFFIFKTDDLTESSKSSLIHFRKVDFGINPTMAAPLDFHTFFCTCWIGCGSNTPVSMEVGEGSFCCTVGVGLTLLPLFAGGKRS